MGSQSRQGRRASRASRGLSRAREEAGFTIVELLVVMIILALLAAVALPAFFSQKDKADDARVKTYARAMATAMETCASENHEGEYVDCDLARLQEIEPVIPDDAQVLDHSAAAYRIQAPPADGTGNLFRVEREDGRTDRTCTIGAAGSRGGCNTPAEDPSAGDTGTW